MPLTGSREPSAKPDIHPYVSSHVETVVLLSQLKPDDVVRVNLELDDLDVAPAETKASHQEIKDYVFQNYGLKVSSLYISQVKRKCGIIERENYNKAKSDGAKVPQVTPEKETAIRVALKYFQMI